MADYFVEEHKFKEEVFRHRFRMLKRLFLKIVSDVQENNPWFQEGMDERMKKSFTPLQKVTLAIKQLAIGNPPDENDEYLNMAERTSQLRGQYMREDHRYPTIMLEVMVSQDLWIWHAFCGPPGSQNDINVLQQTPLFLTQRNGTAPKCPFYVNNHLYKRGYYLTDGIYPTWSVFVKSFVYLHILKEKKFKRQHEVVRKDVERAFGVLKAKWSVLN
ncbi:uncharacterized protein LOC110881697 [Helianthus annuus]|uniref:uncharacterized protein LOC110881697 n=1 Tax=Helianthus annuus TaxID=4232 RepID=UPI000B8FE162|nr:uncharacterized protein LOC110881697 [Helianthus annuus]